MYNRRVKFGLKIPNCFGKNVRKNGGGFRLTLCILKSGRGRLITFAAIAPKLVLGEWDSRHMPGYRPEDGEAVIEACVV